jgi:hypothetical protein
MESKYSADGGPVLDMFVMATIRYLYHYCRGPSVVQNGEKWKKNAALAGRPAKPVRFLVGAPASVPTEMTDLTFVKNDRSKHGENSYCITLSEIHNRKKQGPNTVELFQVQVQDEGSTPSWKPSFWALLFFFVSAYSL